MISKYGFKTTGGITVTRCSLGSGYQYKFVGPHDGRKAILTHFSGAGRDGWSVAYYYEQSGLKADCLDDNLTKSQAAERAADFVMGRA